MSLFKNGVGRPSNETLKKRKIAYMCIIVVLSALLCGAVVVTVKHFKGVSGVNKNAAPAHCVMPYNRKACGDVYSNTHIKKIQQMLSKISCGSKKCYTAAIDGKFGKATEKAISDFQSTNKSRNGVYLQADANVGPATMEQMAIASKTSYYYITYNPNGGSGSLNYSGNYYTGAWDNHQVILSGDSTALSVGKYNPPTGRSSYEHVGYIDTRTNYYYKIGQYVSSFKAVRTSLYAVYCPKGQDYSKNKTNCITPGNPGGGGTSTVTPKVTCSPTSVNAGSTIACTLTYNFTSSTSVNWALTTNKGTSTGSSSGIRGTTASSKSFTVPSGASGTATIKATVSGKTYTTTVTVKSSGGSSGGGGSATKFEIAKDCKSEIRVTAPDGIKKIVYEYTYGTTCKKWSLFRGTYTVACDKTERKTINLNGQLSYSFKPSFISTPKKGTIKAWDKRGKTVNSALNVYC